MEENEYLTPKEVSQKLRINLITIYELIKAKEIPSAKIGRSIRVPRQALDEYMARQYKKE